MRTWMADLIGLVIGFALGGAALAHFWPQIEAWRLPAMGELLDPPHPAPALPLVQTPHRHPEPASPQVAIAPPAQSPLPDITVTLPAPAPLPAVQEPDEPGEDETTPPPNTLVSGTGFFVSEHLVMTAAHVVPGCRQAAIVSPALKLSPVSVAARDTHNDIALLRTSAIAAPAILAIGHPAQGATRVFMLGYPESAGMTDPEATSGVLENDKLRQVPTYDPRQHILMEASAVRHGYSGGAIFDPSSGNVVGIVRATLLPSRSHQVAGLPDAGLAVGPGSALLDAFLQDEAPGTDAFPADQWGDDPLVVLRRATVHVLCWH